VTENAISEKRFISSRKDILFSFDVLSVTVSLLINSLQGLPSCCKRLCHHLNHRHCDITFKYTVVLCLLENLYEYIITLLSEHITNLQNIMTSHNRSHNSSYH